MQMRADDKFWDLIVAVLFPQGPLEFSFFFFKQRKNPNCRAVGLHASLALIFIYVWNQRRIKPQFVLSKMDGEPWLANWSQTESSVGLIRQGKGGREEAKERQLVEEQQLVDDRWLGPPTRDSVLHHLSSWAIG